MLELCYYVDMKKICVVTGDNLLEVRRSVLAQAGRFAKLWQKIVVLVPAGQEDAFEEELFGAFEKNAVFNVQIMSILHFARAQLEQHGASKKMLSSLQAQMLVAQAMQQCESELKTLSCGKDLGAASLVLEEIQKFQQGRLCQQDVKKLGVGQDEFLKAKLHDLAVIYEKYLALGKDFWDESKVLQQFLDLDCKFENTIFAMAGFWDFSDLEFAVAKHLAKSGANFVLGAWHSSGQANSYIFNNALASKFLALGDEGFKVEHSVAKRTLLSKQQTIKNLAFSTQGQVLNLDFVQVFEAQNAEVEILNAGCKIKHLLANGAKNQDIAVGLANFDAYVPVLKNIFLQLGLDCFIAQRKPLATTTYAQFLINALLFLAKPKSKHFFALAMSELSGLPSAAKHELCQVFEALGGEINLNFDECPECALQLCALKDKLLSCQTPNAVQTAQNIILQFEMQTNCAQAAQKLFLKGQTQLASAERVAVEKIVALCQEIAAVQTNLTLEEFTAILKSAMLSAAATMQKPNGNEILVAEVDKIYVEKKYLFLLGANQGVFPTAKADTAILNDADLYALAQTALRASTKNANRKSRFNAFLALQNFQERLFISYCLADQTGQKLLPSEVAQTLIARAEKNIKVNLSKTYCEQIEHLPLAEKAKLFAQKTGALAFAKQEYLKMQKDASNQFACLVPTLAHFWQNKQSCATSSVISAPANLFFADGKTKISQIESYYACPFKQFMAYGLKLTENRLAKLQSFDNGNILHKVAERFLSKNNAFWLGKVGIDENVQQIFEQMKGDKTFKNLFLHINRFSLDMLKKEAVRLCTKLHSMLMQSGFKPQMLELYFGKNQNFEIEVAGQKFLLAGIVDRVDVCGDKAVIIDYKTGSHDKGNNDELFYGEKIQLFVYAKAIEKICNKQVQGVFYFPIVNRYVEEAKAPKYALKGKNINQEDFILAFDKTLSFEKPQSSLFSCSMKTSEKHRKNGIVEFTSKSTNMATPKNFENMKNYAMQLLKNAVKEILEGNVAVSPKEDACKFCPYFAICQKPVATVPRLKQYAVDDSDFELWQNKKGEDDGNKI